MLILRADEAHVTTTRNDGQHHFGYKMASCDPVWVCFQSWSASFLLCMLPPGIVFLNRCVGVGEATGKVQWTDRAG